ncbi:hypothetical protein ONZ45_g15840 [Pleurotus djamor]|nr:hypothetical protein ONZ45_g15840 [Pleurotus djamor]
MLHHGLRLRATIVLPVPSRSNLLLTRLYHGPAPTTTRPNVLTTQRQRTEPAVDIFNTTVLRINQAIQSRNIEIIWEYWQYLQKQRRIRFLGHVQLKRISTLLTDAFCPLGQPETPWNDLEQKVLEEVAIVAASNGATDALNACMLAHIQRNNSDAVLTLYKRFMDLVAESDHEVSETASLASLRPDVNDDEGSDAFDDLVTATHSSSENTPYRPGRITILLHAITAHAMKDAFLDALETSLNTSIRLQHFATTTYLANLRDNPKLQHIIDSYITRLRTATLIANPTELSKRVATLAASRAPRSIERLYTTIMDAISGDNPFVTVNESRKSRQTPVVFTEVCWTSFLVGFLKCGRKDLASKMWDDMTGLGVRPGVSTWTAYLDACDSMSASAEAQAGWELMLQQGIKPDALTYRALISAQFNAHLPDDAMKSFNSFLLDLGKTSPAKQTLVMKLKPSSNACWTSTIRQNLTSVSYNTFLKYWSRMGDLRMLASVMNDMTASGIQGDVFSFSTILSALLKVGRDDAPDLMISLMRKHGVEPNVAIYSAIMDQQLREQTVESLHIAMRLLQKMELDPNLHPNEVTYTSFLAGIYRGSWLPPAVAEDWRRNIVTRMRKRGIKLNRVTYHILLKACLEYPEPEGISRAMAYYKEMVKKRIQPITITWFILLSGLLRRGEVELANQVVEDMVKSGAQPTGAIAELMYKTRKRMRLHGNKR